MATQCVSASAATVGNCDCQDPASRWGSFGFFLLSFFREKRINCDAIHRVTHLTLLFRNFSSEIFFFTFFQPFTKITARCTRNWPLQTRRSISICDLFPGLQRVAAEIHFKV